MCKIYKRQAGLTEGGQEEGRRRSEEESFVHFAQRNYALHEEDLGREAEGMEGQAIVHFAQKGGNAPGSLRIAIWTF